MTRRFDATYARLQGAGLALALALLVAACAGGSGSSGFGSAVQVENDAGALSHSSLSSVSARSTAAFHCV